jgi:hypothetical protein
MLINRKATLVEPRRGETSTTIRALMRQQPTESVPRRAPPPTGAKALEPDDVSQTTTNVTDQR